MRCVGRIFLLVLKCSNIYEDSVNEANILQMSALVGRLCAMLSHFSLKVRCTFCWQITELKVCLNMPSNVAKVNICCSVNITIRL